MRVLVTGGAGFIGRWVVKELLNSRHNVYVLDNLSSGKLENLSEFQRNPKLKVVTGDIRDEKTLSDLFKMKLEVCIHLAALINVQKSIDHPQEALNTNVYGTFNILERARSADTKVVFVSTCMVYDVASRSAPITEKHPIKPASPYAASKLAAENLVQSYHYAYDLPTLILRPFNIYGPFQRTDGEGGVVSVFIRCKLEGKNLNVFGNGTQTRDFLYVEDCADFIAKASFSDNVNGEILNAGYGEDTSINELALLISQNSKKVKHVKHPHPQSEIQKLICDYNKTKMLIGWKPKTTLKGGIRKTEEWIKAEMKL